MNAIQTENLTYYIDDNLVLDSVSVKVPEKSFTLIFGPNGAGKTCFLKLLLDLLKPSSGDIKIFGQSPQNAGKHIGYVPQNILRIGKLPLTVSNAIMMGRYRFLGLFGYPKENDIKIVNKVMEEVGLSDIKDKELSHLSGGQLQRVALARALAGEPKVLLLDEASSALDFNAKETLFDLIERFKKEMAVLLVTHDMTTVTQGVDFVMCLNKKLVSHGKPEVALSDSALSCMYGDQARFFTHCHVHGEH